MSGVVKNGAAMNSRVIQADWLLEPEGNLLPAASVVVDDGGVLWWVGQTQDLPTAFAPLPVEKVRGLLTPGLLNLHAHLDLCWAWGSVPGGEGLFAWILSLRNQPQPGEAEKERAALDKVSRAVAQGTQIFVSVGEGLLAARVMEKTGAVGAALWEVLGRDEATGLHRMALALDETRQQHAGFLEKGVFTGLTPHAPYSLHPPLFQELAQTAQGPLSLHFAETPHEADFWLHGLGPVKDFLENLGVPPDFSPPPAASPLVLLEENAAPLLAVHALFADQFEGGLRNALQVFCPRSTTYISGAPPPAPPWPRFGLGTDSLASAPGLHVLDEARFLFELGLCPDAAALFMAMTQWPARHLGWWPQLGALNRGATPGLVLFDVPPDCPPNHVLGRALAAPSRSLVQARLDFSQVAPAPLQEKENTCGAH